MKRYNDPDKDFQVSLSSLRGLRAHLARDVRNRNQTAYFPINSFGSAVVRLGMF